MSKKKPMATQCKNRFFSIAAFSKLADFNIEKTLAKEDCNNSLTKAANFEGDLMAAVLQDDVKK